MDPMVSSMKEIMMKLTFFIAAAKTGKALAHGWLINLVNRIGCATVIW